MSNSPLAIHGGNRAITLPAPHWPRKSAEIKDALEQLINDGTWSHYHGTSLDGVAKRLKDYLDTPHLYLCSSGTIAVELALRGLGVGPGDEVILAGYDFPGNFRAIESIGARPVLVDVAAGRWIMDTTRLTSARSASTKALIASHLHGELADIEPIVAWGSENQIAIVEDACQVPGARLLGRRTGTFGHAGVFSFGGSKLLTAGRGGAVATGSSEVLQRIKIFSERGNNAFPLSQLQAAVLSPQLDELDELNERRHTGVQWFRQQCANLELFHCPATDTPSDSMPAYYKLGMHVTRPEKRERIVAALQAEGVEVGSAFRGFAQRSGRRCRRSGELDNCIRASRDTILVHHTAFLGDKAYLDQLASAFVKVNRAFI